MNSRLESIKNSSLFYEESTALELTEIICLAINRTKTKRKDLAKKLNITKKRLNKILSSSKISSKTVGKILFLLGYELKTTLKKIKNENSSC